MNSFTRHPWVIPAGLFLLTLLAYASSFPGAFILDDLHIAQENRLVQAPDLYTIFTTDYWLDFENSGLFRPVTILSLALNRQLLGSGAWGFHLVNVLLHGGVVVLIWQLLRGWKLTVQAAFAGAAVFAVHPLHLEAVNIVVGRSELLVAFFLLAAFLFARHGGRASAVPVCFCYLLALCSKEHAITFLALLPLTEAFFGGYHLWRRRWPLYAGLLAVAIAWLGWRHYFIILGNPLPRFPLTEAAAPLAFVDLSARVLTALHHQGWYLLKLFVPHGLQSVYSVNDMPEFVRSAFSLTGLLVAAGTVLVLGALVHGWRRRSFLALCGSLYLLSFLPTSNLFFATGATFAERLAYFPSVWFCAGLAGVLTLAMRQGWWRQWCWVVPAFYLLFLCGALLLRSPDYAGELTLWSAEVEDNPADFLGWQSLAESYNNLGRYEEADLAFQTMLSLAPDYPGGLRSRTAFFLTKGMYERALPSAERVYELSRKKQEPIAMAFDALELAEVTLKLNDCGRAMGLLDGPALPLIHHLRAREVRAVTLACLDRHEEAVKIFAGIEGEPKEHRMRYQHGLSLFTLGRLDEARVQLQNAVAQNDDDAAAWNLLGVVCAQSGEWDAAIAALEQAVALAPDNTGYHENLNRAQRKGL